MNEVNVGMPAVPCRLDDSRTVRFATWFDCHNIIATAGKPCAQSHSVPREPQLGAGSLTAADALRSMAALQHHDAAGAATAAAAAAAAAAPATDLSAWHHSVDALVTLRAAMAHSVDRDALVCSCAFDRADPRLDWLTQ
jgi:hypothetical protein